MTQALYKETAAQEVAFLEEDKRRLNVNGVLKTLGVSRSGYAAWKKHTPSKQEVRKKK